jgi:hypothetical protein
MPQALRRGTFVGPAVNPAAIAWRTPVTKQETRVGQQCTGTAKARPKAMIVVYPLPALVLRRSCPAGRSAVAPRLARHALGSV